MVQNDVKVAVHPAVLRNVRRHVLLGPCSLLLGLRRVFLDLVLVLGLVAGFDGLKTWLQASISISMGTK